MYNYVFLQFTGVYRVEGCGFIGLTVYKGVRVSTRNEAVLDKVAVAPTPPDPPEKAELESPPVPYT